MGHRRGIPLLLVNVDSDFDHGWTERGFMKGRPLTHLGQNIRYQASVTSTVNGVTRTLTYKDMKRA